MLHKFTQESFHLQFFCILEQKHLLTPCLEQFYEQYFSSKNKDLTFAHKKIAEAYVRHMPRNSLHNFLKVFLRELYHHLKNSKNDDFTPIIQQINERIGELTKEEKDDLRNSFIQNPSFASYFPEIKLE